MKKITIDYDFDGNISPVSVEIDDDDTYETLTEKIGQNAETVLVFCDEVAVPLDDIVGDGKIRILKVTFDGR